jgi:hypothetical protein
MMVLESIRELARMKQGATLTPKQLSALMSHVEQLEQRLEPTVLDERHVLCPACNQVRGCVHLVAELERLRAAARDVDQLRAVVDEQKVLLEDGKHALAEARAISDALREALADERTAARHWYLPDGRAELLTAQEVVRRRVACAVAIGETVRWLEETHASPALRDRDEGADAILAQLRAAVRGS